MESKLCRPCGECKTLDMFYRNKNKRDGHASLCKSCSQAYIAREREKIKEYRRLYRQENKEALREYNQRWAEENPELTAKYKKDYADRNPEKVRHKEVTYRKNNRERINQYRRQWFQRNPGKRSQYENARRLNSVDGFSALEWLELCSKYGNKCLACNGTRPLTVDHVVPIHKGGGNELGNIQPLCGPCNSAKGTQVIDYR